MKLQRGRINGDRQSANDAVPDGSLSRQALSGCIMNQCQCCGEPATVHLTDIVNKKKREMHLCENCAREHKLIPSTPESPLNLAALIELVVNAPSDSSDPAALICPACGLKYAQFRVDGRLGCPHDYEAFRSALEPLVERVHRSVSHTGKVPRSRRREAELDHLRAALQAAVEAEQYEEAARLRDRIRAKEAAE